MNVIDEFVVECGKFAVAIDAISLSKQHRITKDTFRMDAAITSIFKPSTSNYQPRHLIGAKNPVLSE